MFDHPFIDDEYLQKEIISNIKNEFNPYYFYNVKPSAMTKQINNIKNEDEILYCILVCANLIDLASNPKQPFFQYGFIDENEKPRLNMDNIIIRKLIKLYYTKVKNIVSFNYDNNDENIEYHTEHLLNQYSRYRKFVQQKRIRPAL